MSIWHRKKSSGRKRPRSGNSFSDRDPTSPREQTHVTDYPETHMETPRTPPPRRRTTLKKRRTEAPKPQAQQQTHEYANQQNTQNGRYSFTENRPDEIRIAHRRPMSRQHQSSPLQNYHWDPPTLSPRRPRKKNGKLQKNPDRRDPVREAEIREMSAAKSNRPMSTYSARSKWGSRRTRNAVSRAGPDEHHGDIDEFPSAFSLRSSMSSDGSDAAAYRVNAIGGFLVPRPTLRYTSRPVWCSNSGRFSGSQRNIDLPPVAANIRSRARINELADGLDSSDLRILMERDNRRRQRKKLHDQEQAAERIARRRAEYEEAQHIAIANGTAPPRNLDRGVIGRELMEAVELIPAPKGSKPRPRPEIRPGPEMNIQVARPMTPESIRSYEAKVECASPVSAADDSAMVIETEDEHMEDSASVCGEALDVDGANRPICEEELVQAPHRETADELRDEEEDFAALPTSGSSPTVDVEIQTPISRTSPIAIKPPHASSVSFTPTVSPSIITARSSEPNGTPSKRRSFKSLLRWGSRKRKQPSVSSFSNISRDVMGAEAARTRGENLPPLSTSIGSDCTDFEIPMLTSPTRIVPRRTRSRFREDLPELPISPPLSPAREADLSTIKSVSERLSILYSIASGSPSQRHVRHRSIDALNCGSPGGSSFDMLADAAEPSEESPEMEQDEEEEHDVSQNEVSLGEIDTEGEWFAGKISPKKSSAPAASEEEWGLSTSMSTAVEEGFLHRADEMIEADEIE